MNHTINDKEELRLKYVLRFLIYFAGLFILAIGINLAIISNLGVSPVSALPLSISEVIGVSLGKITIGVYTFYVLIQIIILRKDFKLKSLMQLLFSFVFGFFVDYTSVLVSGINSSNYFLQVLLLLLSIITIPIETVMILNSNFSYYIIIALYRKSKFYS